MGFFLMKVRVIMFFWLLDFCILRWFVYFCLRFSLVFICLSFWGLLDWNVSLSLSVVFLNFKELDCVPIWNGFLGFYLRLFVFERWFFVTYLAFFSLRMDFIIIKIWNYFICPTFRFLALLDALNVFIKEI
jgi:hypothetical protein